MSSVNPITLKDEAVVSSRRFIEKQDLIKFLDLCLTASIQNVSERQLLHNALTENTYKCVEAFEYMYRKFKFEGTNPIKNNTHIGIIYLEDVNIHHYVKQIESLLQNKTTNKQSSNSSRQNFSSSQGDDKINSDPNAEKAYFEAIPALNRVLRNRPTVKDDVERWGFKYVKPTSYRIFSDNSVIYDKPKKPDTTHSPDNEFYSSSTSQQGKQKRGKKTIKNGFLFNDSGNNGERKSDGDIVYSGSS
jgi:hypothetical protein